MDTSNHICLICSTTIVGLLQYVEHFKSHAVPDAVVSYQQEGQASQVKKEKQTTGDGCDEDNTELAKPNTAELPNHSLSQSTSSHVYYDETSPLSAFANQEFPDPDIETDALLSPKYNIDFFQSLELKSINEETIPLTKSKLKATQRLSILEDDIHAENLLPITRILSNLDFSSDDDEEMAGAANIDDNHDRSWSDDDELGNTSRTHPPRNHTGGKWKPGQGPGKTKVSVSASLPVSSSPAFSKKLPIAGKWKPTVSPAPASRKAIMKGNKKKMRGPLADQGIEFRCNVCRDCFSDRTSYSVHFGLEKHKEAVAERRQSKKTKEKHSDMLQGDAMIITEAGVAEAVTVETLSETDGQPKVQNITANVDTALSSQCRDEDQYHCPVCDLYFRSSFVFQTHCETKAHKDGLLKQGFREYRSNDGVIIRVDIRTDNVFTDRQENQLLAAKQPKKLGPSIRLDDEKHECTICRKVFKRKYEMARHLLTRMHRVRAQNKPMEVWVDMLDKYNKYMMRLSLFQCAICQFYFNRQRDFLDHMCSPEHVKSCMDMLGPIMCVVCKYKTHKHEEMMQHLQAMEHYQTVEKSQGLCIIRESHTSITCKFCGIQMHSAARMKRHCQLRHANRLTDVQEALDVRLSLNPHHTCPICQKVFKVKTLLQFHFLRTHKQRSFFTCTICERGFLDQRRLDNHLRTRYHARRVIAARVIDRQDKFYLKRRQKREMNRKGTDKNEGNDVGNDEGTPNENSDGKDEREITAEKSDVADDDKKSHDSRTIDSKRDEGNSEELQKTDAVEVKMVEDEAPNAVVRDGRTDKTVPKNVRRSSRKRKKITFGNEASGESEVDDVGSDCGFELRDRLSVKTGRIRQIYMRDKDGDGKKVKVKRKDKHLLVDLNYVNYLKKSKARSEKKALKYDEIDEDFLEEASKRVFTCTYCDFSALDLLELRKHYNEIHPCDILMCQPCNQLFLSLKAYKIHCTGRGHQLKLREQSGETVMHTCPSCDKRFLQASSCALHVETVHRHPNSEADLQRIQKGSDLVTQLYGDHVAQVEKLSNDTSVSCPECGKFVRKDTLIEHLRLHTGEKPYSCRFCNKSFAGRLTLRRHISSHLDMPLYVCDLCGKEFKRNAHLVKHMQQHDNEKKGVKFACTVCKVSFFTKEELGRHMKRHGERKYPCTWPGCQWFFINPSELKCHMHTHTKDRTFLCDQCGYGAASKARLKRHVKTHENLRPFACDYCPYKASLKTHLVRHMRIHINSKPFACPYCKFTCNTHENIRKHILKTQKHKGKKLYPCKLCSDFGSNSSSEFKGHLMTVHTEYLREHAVDSLAVFSGLYKKEEDFTKPKEGSEIRQVTKGRFYKQYTNTRASSVEEKTLIPKKEKKKEKKKSDSRKTKVVVSQEELEAQALESMGQHQQGELQTSLLNSHSKSLIITPHQSKQIVTLSRKHGDQDHLQSPSKVMQLQLDCSGSALEMTVEQEGDSTASAIEIPHFIEIPNMVIQESLAVAAEVANNNNINDISGQQMFPVAFTVSAQPDDQLKQEELHHRQQQQQQHQEDLQLQQHIQQLQQQQQQQQQQSSGNESRVFWVEATTSDGHPLAASVDSISLGGVTQTQALSASQTNHGSWYTTIPHEVHAPSCHEIANLASSLEVGDGSQAMISSATGGTRNESTSTDTLTECLPDKYFSVTATQIYNSVSGGNAKVVVLDQPACDM